MRLHHITFLFVFLTSLEARSQTAEIDFGTGTLITPQTILVTPGLTFNVQLQLTTNSLGPTGISYDLLASSSNLLTLNTRDVTGSGTPTAFLDPSDLTTANVNGTALNVSAGGGFRTGKDLGGFIPSFPSSDPDGTYFLSTFSFTVSPTATLGSYTLNLFAAGVTGPSPNFNSFSVQTSGLDILVAPEPSTWAFLLVGLASLAAWGRLQAKPR
jgi:hypothetical protein